MTARDGGIYYEINNEHPFVKDMFEEYPQAVSKLRRLLEQIGLNLPLNSLYLDLTNDEKLAIGIRTNGNL